MYVAFFMMQCLLGVCYGLSWENSDNLLDVQVEPRLIISRKSIIIDLTQTLTRSVTMITNVAQMSPILPVSELGDDSDITIREQV